MIVSEVTEAALQLSEEERFDLVESLWDSLPSVDPLPVDASAQVAWERYQVHRANPGRVWPWRDALGTIRAKYVDQPAG
ncbi:MAG: addiction module protein [Propionibacteriaceae bacterium]|jgi:hypothetical protein|nr:addiction module protein [Propionibacteriaceae bacterium]